MKRFNPIFLILLLSTLIFLGCKKTDGLFPKKELALSAPIQLLKNKFDESKLESSLVKPFNNTSNLYLEPLWSRASQKTVDDIEYTYVPLIAKIANKGSDIKQTINSVSIRKYLLIQTSNGKISFKEATFFTKDSLVGKIGFTKNPIIIVTSALLTVDLKTKQAAYYDLLHKASNNSQAMRETGCKTMFYCEYYTGCGQIYTLTATVSEYGCACPTQTFQDCQDKGGCHDGYWYFIESFSYEVCDIDNNPPWTPDSRYVFARIEEGNEQFNSWTDNNTYHESRTKDVYLRFYKDMACTIPTGVDPSIMFNYQTSFQTNSSLYGSNGLSYYISTVHSPDNSVTSIYLGNLTSYWLDRYDDPNFGTVSDEVWYDWVLVVGNNYDYYYRPTNYY